MEDRINELVRCASKVFNILGAGFTWEIYRNALFVEMDEKKISYEKGKTYPIMYKKKLVGEFFADIVVDETLIVQVMKSENISSEDVTRMRNFIRLSGKESGIILNFGHRLMFEVFRLEKTETQDDMFKS
ncbi:MAG: GxxExxY protein [Firmicutes bacterium]|nr:GxxExxY protein [Bacillota bacterium]